MSGPVQLHLLLATNGFEAIFSSWLGMHWIICCCFSASVLRYLLVSALDTSAAPADNVQHPLQLWLHLIRAGCCACT
jgi:hypothetical protein